MRPRSSTANRLFHLPQGGVSPGGLSIMLYPHAGITGMRDMTFKGLYTILGMPPDLAYQSDF